MTSVIDVAGLVELLGEPGRDVVVVDATVRLLPARHDGDHRSTSGAPEWAADHLPGSIHLDLGDELADGTSPLHYAHLDADRLVAALAARGIGPGTTVVAYDRGDLMWASRLWWTLRWIGLDVRVLDGGLPAWEAAAPTVTASGPRGPVPPWTPTTRDPHWVSLDDVRAVVEGDAPGTLVCGLGADAFTGSAPTRYARRGHIPGSVNVPARGHVGPDGLLRDVDELRAAYAGIDRRPVLLYCGGGISATLNALALTEAGVDDIAVYDGSLEEWSADPSLPLVSG
jgi:thiosulfate/3-mercaptopyruvate sulfurtransferase